MSFDLISIAIDRIKMEIPEEVLQLAFAPTKYDPSRRDHFRNHYGGVSTDAMIRRAIIDARVAIDVDLCSGVEVIIPLNNVPTERIDPWNIIYRIPKSLTDGRTITNVYSISFGQGDILGAYHPTSLNSSAALDAAAGVMQSNMPWTMVQSARVNLIGENTVLLSNIGQFPGLLFLRAQVTNEPNFANIQPQYYDKFTMLCIYAAQAYVHRRLLIRLDEGQIKAGATLSRIREVVDGYADANNLYREHLRDEWRVAAVFNDKPHIQRLHSYIVGGKR